MSLQGLPDFQQPLQGEGFAVYYPFEGVGSHFVFPHELAIAPRSDGRPDFALELVRGVNPLLPPAPYGVLELRLEPRYPSQAALELVRARHPRARLGYPLLEAGYLRLSSPAEGPDLPDELLEPTALGWGGLSRCRFVRKLSRDGAAVLRRALEGDALALIAWVDVRIDGVSPRVPVTVRLSPRPLLERLAPAGGRVTWDEVEELFSGEAGSLPLEITGELEEEQRRDFAAALADRLCRRYAVFGASPADRPGASLELPAPSAAPEERLEWNLQEPLRVSRPFLFRLDPLEAARFLVREQGLASVVRETVVPPIPTGAHLVQVTANLPRLRPGVVSLGVTLRVAPAPPHRPEARVETVELLPPADAATVRLRLSPADELAYTYSAFAVVKLGSTFERLAAAERSHAGGQLDLGPDDFPLGFLTVEATPALLELARVTGLCRVVGEGGPFDQGFALSPEEPTLGLPFPQGARAERVRVEAAAREGEGSLELELSAGRGVQLDLASFPQYGAHRIEVECRFETDAEPLAALELVPEDRRQEEATVLHFTPSHRRREWTYLARSPFRAGYLYRPFRGPEAEAAEWSPVQPPFAALRLVASAAGVAPDAGPAPAAGSGSGTGEVLGGVP